MKKILFLMGITLSLLSCDIIKENEVFENIPQPTDTNVTIKSRDRIALVEYYTGHQCGNCPEKGADVLKSNKSFFGNKVVYISVHAGFFARTGTKFPRNFKTTTGDALAEKYGLSATPVGTINRLGSGGEALISPEKWSEKIQEITAQKVNFGISTNNKSINASSAEVTIEIDADETIDSYKCLTYWAEDSIISPQKDYTLPEGNQDILDYAHRYVLRGQMGTEQTFDIAAGEKRTFTFQTNIPSDVNINKVYAFVLVLKGEEVLQVSEIRLN